MPVLDDVEAVEQRRLVGRVEFVLAEGLVARLRVVTPDLEADLHQYFLSSGRYFVNRTSLYVSSGAPSFQRVIECFMKFSSSRVG